MWKTLLLVVMLAVIMLVIPTMARAESLAQGIEDIVLGNEGTYANLELVKRIELDNSVVGIDEIQVGVYFYGEISEPVGAERVYVGGPKIKLIW